MRARSTLLKICNLFPRFVRLFVGENGVKLHFTFEMLIGGVQGVYETGAPKEVRRQREIWGSSWLLKPRGWLRSPGREFK